MTPRNLGKPRSVLLLFTRKTTLTRHVAVLGDAVAELSEGCELVLEVIDAARKYAEGRGVRLEVRNEDDLRSVVQLADVRMAN